VLDAGAIDAHVLVRGRPLIGVEITSASARWTIPKSERATEGASPRAAEGD